MMMMILSSLWCRNQFFYFFHFPSRMHVWTYSGLGPSLFMLISPAVHDSNTKIWSLWSAPALVQELETKAITEVCEVTVSSFGFEPSKGPVLPPARELIYRKRHSAEMFFGEAQNLKYDWLMCKINHQVWFCAGLTLVREPAMRCGFTLLSQRKWWNGGCFSEVTCCCCQMYQLAVRCLIF